ncbi:YdbL family protein [Verrucomicrobiaceae bacterium R5-34]|uniref:YdbL family protein n=1 Tax=Oceaniferula flava TaxID=2800421 RepID=A0AAE2SEN1_9BACT|nr:YdbL family protein [Oceaniferula flavus]MBK1829993.1 YdbL family protein [Verrucomicrobiaceae bacterium R5-34]MBK1855160.1 YdbL family protein [Oceaniferula flavus]MBM1136466.1 YdbL family protein [Oceaniferula flavus]
MKRSLAALLSLFILVVGMAPVSTQAASSAELKSRMAQRLGKIVALKQKGTVGENNLGYLSPRGSLSGGESALVKAENADRRAVYQLIAAKTKSTASAVGKARAKRIRSSAPSGTWVQMADGSWKKA